jgi:hypothetical protein
VSSTDLDLVLLLLRHPTLTIEEARHLLAAKRAGETAPPPDPESMESPVAGADPTSPNSPPSRPLSAAFRSDGAA